MVQRAILHSLLVQGGFMSLCCLFFLLHTGFFLPDGGWLGLMLETVLSTILQMQL